MDIKESAEMLYYRLYNAQLYQVSEVSGTGREWRLQRIVKRIAVCHYIWIVTGQEQQNLLNSQRTKGKLEASPTSFFFDLTYAHPL
jgi:hypothetical protein